MDKEGKEMAMIARVAEDKQNLLQPENVWQKLQKDSSLHREKDDTVIGKAAEVVRAAVEEGKARAEKAADETERLADSGLNRALKMQSQMQVSAVAQTGTKADDERNTQLKEIKKLSYEEFMRDARNKERDLER